MAIRGYDIGGMLARSGQAQGQQIASGFSQLGQGLEGLFSGVTRGLQKRQERKEREETAQEVQQLLQQYANNPAQLNAMGQKYASEGNNEMAELFFDAAKSAVAKETAGQQRGVQGGLMAITQAASRGTPLEDLQEAQRSVIRLGGTAEDIRAAYESGLPKTKTPEYDFSEETILVDGKPTRVQVATNKSDPTDKRITTIGETPPKEGAEGAKTLTQQLKDAGVPEVDLTTLEGAQQARRDIIAITGNASLANSVGNIIEDLTPLSVKEGLDIVRSTNPEFVEAENLREQTSRFATLAELSDQDIAGLSALIERTLTATTENDIKAVAELERFRKAKDLPQRITDFALEIATGKLSPETIEEYSTLAAAFEELAERRMSRALDAMIVNGSPKESDAAQRAKNQILGVSQARIIN